MEREAAATVGTPIRPKRDSGCSMPARMPYSKEARSSIDPRLLEPPGLPREPPGLTRESANALRASAVERWRGETTPPLKLPERLEKLPHPAIEMDDALELKNFDPDWETISRDPGAAANAGGATASGSGARLTRAARLMRVHCAAPERECDV
eukprot:CAMPEP_0180042006 /NCGR_PEP_ID=MMETSP0984-20121128/34482_1 /TAXON_ID=483367 /ORGANISM="non described non described, Strain CCMP 2436" /LENGTH=152 /DNA_ID=CAMNT_0021969723 /DNA_START=369 /DNA_END=828 /DNA_ORIENTATION=-